MEEEGRKKRRKEGCKSISNQSERSLQITVGLRGPESFKKVGVSPPACTFEAELYCICLHSQEGLI